MVGVPGLPAGAQRLVADGSSLLVLEGRPGSGAGQLIISSAPSLPLIHEAGTDVRRPPRSPASMFAHWTIGTPGERAAQMDGEHGFASELAASHHMDHILGRS